MYSVPFFVVVFKFLVRMHGRCTGFGDKLFGQLQDSCVFKVNDAAAWAWFYLDARNLPIFILLSAEVVSDRLLFDVKLLGDAGNTAGGQAVLDLSQFIEGDIHIDKILFMPQLAVGSRLPSRRKSVESSGWIWEDWPKLPIPNQQRNG